MDTGPAAWGRPLYERVLDAVGEVDGGPLLDVGCGTGQLCRLAADRGIEVRGVDADRAALALAARLVPRAELAIGELPTLPVPDRSAAAVSCVQVLMHVPNPLAALRELARVARRGAPVVVTVWGPPEQCAVGAFGRALAPLLGRPGGDRRAGSGDRGAGPGDRRAGSGDRRAGSGDRRLAPGGPPPLSAPGRLTKLAELAGLSAAVEQDVRCAFDYPDERALLAGLYAAELGRRAVAAAGRAPVRKAVLAALADYRTAEGGYRLENAFRMLVARA